MSFPRSVIRSKEMQAIRLRALEGKSTAEDVFALISSHEILRARLLLLQERQRST